VSDKSKVPRIMRLADMTPAQRRLVLALVETAKEGADEVTRTGVQIVDKSRPFRSRGA
jgi:hypothetical protein